MRLFPLLPASSPKALSHAWNVSCGTFALLLAFSLLTDARNAAAEDGKVFRTARLTYLSGDVRVEQNTGSESSPAVVNLPLVQGAVLSTGDDGEAEVEFEDGSLLRLTPRSGAGLVTLTANTSGEYRTRISVLGGLAYLELRATSKFHYVVDAGGEEVSPIDNAVLRVNFDHPPATVSILDGSAHVTGPAGTDLAASSGQTVQPSDGDDSGALVLKESIAPESWDQWNQDRDSAAAKEAPVATDVRSQFAGDQGYGWSDLDSNGNWYEVPGHGEVWQPNEAVQSGDGSEDGSSDVAAAQSSFDPYGYGSWAYTPAGYVWASGYGWGWLPYRCGTWNYWDGFGWGWSPAGNCGAFGFGGYYDGGVYIGRAPATYKKPGRPIPRPGPIHPILHGRGGPVPIGPVHSIPRSDNEVHVIAGNPVTPLARAGNQGALVRGYSSNSRRAVETGLQRDFPIDQTTHAPVTGREALSISQPPSSSSRPVWHPSQPPTGTQPPASVQRPGLSRLDPGGGRAVPVTRPATVAAPRPSAPTPIAAPRSAPAPAASTSSHPK